MNYTVGQKVWFEAGRDGFVSETVTVQADLGEGKFLLSNGHNVTNGKPGVLGELPKWYGQFYLGSCYESESHMIKAKEHHQMWIQFREDVANAPKFTLDQITKAREALGL